MDIGIEHTKKIADILHVTLANQHVLYQKLRNHHWNVVGKNFHSLHELFETMYTALSEDIDEVAERIRSLGENTKGTMKEYLELSELKELPGSYPDDTAILKELLADLESVIRSMRNASAQCGEYGDAGTEDMLIAIMKTQEKQAWMVRSLLAV